MDKKDDGGKPKPAPPPQRKRLEPSEKQLKQQSSHGHHGPPQRQRSFQQTQTIMAGLYDLEETLGKGHFATVKAAKHVFTGERVAVKVIDKAKLDEVSQKALLKEVLCMKLVQHPNVVKLYEVIDTTSKMYLVLELGQGDLYDLILKQQGGLPEPQARVYFKQILKAVSYCHKLHVAHRDLKPENVVFFPPQNKSKSSSSTSTTIPTPTPSTSAPVKKLGQVKLTDFGFSNKFCPGVKLDTSCGSLAYSAPEILLGDSYDAPAVDIWSLGVILYMLVSGRAPFQEANDSETLTMIMDVKYSIPDVLSKELKDLIRRMLVRDPRRRARLSEIEGHEWVKKKEGSAELEEELEDDEDEPLYCSSILPLIASNTISEHESERIFEDMVKGRVVSNVEEVKSSLRSNAYNYITSTYYLLAERLLREKARRSSLKPDGQLPQLPGCSSTTPTSSSSSTSTPTKTTQTQPQPSPLPPTTEEVSSSPHRSSQSSPQPSSTSSSPPPSQHLLIRKNSHQFEDVVLPSVQETKPPPQLHTYHVKETASIAGLDLERSAHTRKFTVTLPEEDDDEEDDDSHQRYHHYNRSTPTKSHNNSPHHPHYYHHLGKRISSPLPPDTTSTSTTGEVESQVSPPPTKYCNSARSKMKPHHSHSDSSDEGGGGACGGGGSSSAGSQQQPTIRVTTTATEESTSSPTSVEEKVTNNNFLSHHHHHHNNHFHHLKPSPSYEGIVEEVEDENNGKRSSSKNKKRLVFLSWFFKKTSKSNSKSSSSRSNGGSSSGSSGGGANGIYKTRSCAELKMRSVRGDDNGGDLSTRECFSVCNNGEASLHHRKVK